MELNPTLKDEGPRPRGAVTLRRIRSLLESLEADRTSQDEEVATLKAQLQETTKRAILAEQTSQMMGGIIDEAASIVKTSPDNLVEYLREAFKEYPLPQTNDSIILRGQVLLCQGQFFVVDVPFRKGGTPNGLRLKKEGGDYILDPSGGTLRDVVGYDPANLSTVDSFPTGTRLRKKAARLNPQGVPTQGPEEYEAVITDFYFAKIGGRLKYSFSYQNKTEGPISNGALLSSLQKGYAVISAPSEQEFGDETDLNLINIQ